VKQLRLSNEDAAASATVPAAAASVPGAPIEPAKDVPSELSAPIVEEKSAST